MENFSAIIRHFASWVLIRLSYGEGGWCYASYHTAAEHKNAPAHAAAGGGAGGRVSGRAGGAAFCIDAARPRRLCAARRRPAAARGHAACRARRDLRCRRHAACGQRDLLDDPRRPAGDGGRSRGACRKGAERDSGAGLRRDTGKIQPADFQRLPAAPPRGQGDGRCGPGLVPRQRCAGCSDPTGHKARLPAGEFYGRYPWFYRCGQCRAVGAGAALQ